MARLSRNACLTRKLHNIHYQAHNSPHDGAGSRRQPPGRRARAAAPAAVDQRRAGAGRRGSRPAPRDAVALGASPPAGDAPAAQIATYFAEHRGGHLANTFLSALGAFVLFPWFLVSLWRAIRRLEGEHGLCAPMVLVAGVALLGPLLIQIAGWGAAALHAGDQRDPAVAAALLGSSE